MSRMAPGDTRHEDPGLQPERTALAWTRTSLSLCVASATLLRWTRVLGPWALVLVGAFIALAIVLAATHHRRYWRHNAGLKRGTTPANAGGVVSLSAACLLLGLLAAGLILSSAPPLSP